MLYSGNIAAVSGVYDNWSASPSANIGTSVTCGTSSAEGLWTPIAAASDVSSNIEGFEVIVTTASNTGDRQILLDIGVDPAGGSSYTAIISNIVCGNPGTFATGMVHKYLFPMFIAAGSSIAARATNGSVTAITIIVAARFFAGNTSPETFPRGQFSETIGTITNSNGASFTPGNAVWGTWTLLGTTTLPLWWWQLAYSVSNGTITGEYTYIQLGTGGAAIKQIIGKHMHLGNTAETVGEQLGSNLIFFNSYCPVPSGTDIYIRGRCNNAPDTGYNAVAIGIGG
jgi:hypothetical protein